MGRKKKQHFSTFNDLLVLEIYNGDIHFDNLHVWGEILRYDVDYELSDTGGRSVLVIEFLTLYSNFLKEYLKNKTIYFYYEDMKFRVHEWRGSAKDGYIWFKAVEV